jgi:hypothetical protein
MKVLFLASSALVVASVSAVCDFDLNWQGTTRDQCISWGCYWVESVGGVPAQCEKGGMRECCTMTSFLGETLCKEVSWESEYWQGRANCTWHATADPYCKWDGPPEQLCETQSSQEACTNLDSVCAWLITIPSSKFGGCYDSRRANSTVTFDLACRDYGKHNSSSDPTCANVEMHDQAGVHLCKYNAVQKGWEPVGCTCGNDDTSPFGCLW